MRLRSIIALFVLGAALAVAQPQHNRPAPRTAPRSEPRQEPRQTPKQEPRREPRIPRTPRREQPRHEPRTAPRREQHPRQADAHRHWRGSRFDERFYRRHFGWSHPVVFEWVGEPCAIGSYFWFEDIEFYVQSSSMLGCYQGDWFIIWDEVSYSYVLASPDVPQPYVIVSVIW